MADPRITRGTGTGAVPGPVDDNKNETHGVDTPLSPAAKRPSADRGVNEEKATRYLALQLPNKSIEYPVSEAAISAETSRSERLKNELPAWTGNDKKFFLQKMEAGNMLKLEPIIKLSFPSDAEICNHPMVQRFDLNNRGAANYFNEAQHFFRMSGDYLKAGDKRTAQEYFDQGRALEHCGSLMKNRNEQWLQLRRDHRDDAMAKHADNMQEWGMASISVLGADVAAGEVAFGVLSKGYGILKSGMNLAKGAGNVERLAQLEKLLSNPARLAESTPEQLVKLSADLKLPSSLTLAEAHQLINTAKNLPAFQIARSQALAGEILKDIDKLEPGVQDAVRQTLSNDEKLAHAHPSELARMCNISKEEAGTLISGADLRLNRDLDQMSWHAALDTLRKRAGAGDAAAKQLSQEMDCFMRGLEAHQKMMKGYSESFKGIVQKARGMSPEDLQKTYHLPSLDDARLLKKQLNELPEHFNFAAHDLWGPGGKTQTSIARLLGRDAKPSQDAAIAYAMKRHNVQFDHHNARDPISFLEAALDRVDAMRDTTRAYREFKPLKWADIHKETDKIADPVDRVWQRFVQTEIRRMEHQGLDREVQLGPGLPRFTPGN